MDEDDFLLDEEEDDVYISPEEMEEDSDEEDESSEENDDSSKIDTSLYKGKLTKLELDLITAYDEISKSKEIEEAATIIVTANPQHTSTATVSKIIMDMFQKQGHSRMQNNKFTQGLLRGDEVRGMVDEETDDLDIEINNELIEETKEMVDNFIHYLATRDLSKDSITSKRRKNRHIPAFLIFMFSSGIYDYILNCPSMPPEYQEQINFALKKINEEKYKVHEELISAYEKAGRPEVAKRVKEMGLSWFLREPAEIKSSADYRDLNLTSDDIDIYRQYRSSWTNLTTALTQDIISDYIEVVVDPKKGIYEKLKDKTRSDAITDVKKVFKDWVNEYQPDKSGLATKLIFKNL